MGRGKALRVISRFNSPLMLEITLQPDTTTLQEKSSWINALDQMLSQLRQASSGSSLSSAKEGDRNAQLVSRLYEKYQSSYLTESLFRFSTYSLNCGVTVFHIPSENSAKKKLGIDSSITNNKIRDMIKLRPWYIKGQETFTNKSDNLSNEKEKLLKRSSRLW